MLGTLDILDVLELPIASASSSQVTRCYLLWDERDPWRQRSAGSGTWSKMAMLKIRRNSNNFLCTDSWWTEPPETVERHIVRILL